jgi:hypothetical protein
LYDAGPAGAREAAAAPGEGAAAGGGMVLMAEAELAGVVT